MFVEKLQSFILNIESSVWVMGTRTLVRFTFSCDIFGESAERYVELCLLVYLCACSVPRKTKINSLRVARYMSKHIVNKEIIQGVL